MQVIKQIPLNTILIRNSSFKLNAISNIKKKYEFPHQMQSFKKKFTFHRVNDPQKSSSITLIIKIKLCRTNAQKPIRKKIQKISKIQGGTEIEINKRDRAKKKKCSTPPSPLIG